MGALLGSDLGEEPRLIHALPGRARLHAPGWSERTQRLLTPRLLHLAGVYRVRGNPLTGNVLVLFDPVATNAETILAGLRALLRGVATTTGGTHADAGLRLVSPLVGGRSAATDDIVVRRTHGAMPHLIVTTDPDDTQRLSLAAVSPSPAFHGGVADLVRLLGAVSGVLGVGACVVNLLLSGSVFGLIVNGLELLRVCRDALVQRPGPRAPQGSAEDSGHVIIARGGAVWIVV